MRPAPFAAFARLAAVAVLAAASGCISLGSVETGHINAGDPPDGGFADDRGAVQMITAVVGGKNVFIPSTVVVTSGTGRTLSIFNTADKPHGFRIASLGVETILDPGKETVVALPPLEAGHIYEITCQLHPAHRHATLMVVSGP